METTLRLIEDLQTIPCLWDIKSVEYKNRDKRREALESLAKKYNMTFREMEKKLHNLRSQFRREHKKISESKKSGSTTKMCQWFGYQPLLFLLGGIESRNTDRDEEEECQTINDNENKNEGQGDEIEDETINPQEEFCIPPIPKIRKSNVQDYIAKETVNCMKTLTAAVSLRDEFSVYGEHIAHKLRNCGKDPVEISLAQRDIGDIIIKLQMGRYGSDAIWPTRQDINYSVYSGSISPSSTAGSDMRD